MTFSFKIAQFRQPPKYVLALTFLGAGTVLLVGLICGLPQWLNNQRLQRFAYNLQQYPLPPGTEIISRSAQVKLMGNGNHCDFVVTQAMLSRLSPKEIEMYYQNVRLPAVGNGSIYGDKVPLRVSFDESNSVNGKRQFTVKLIDAGYPSGFDIRCH